MQQLKFVFSSFAQNRATVSKTLFYLIKRMKVKFKLMNLPDDAILIDHVADNLHIQSNMFNCWFSTLGELSFLTFAVVRIKTKTCLKTFFMGVAWRVTMGLSSTWSKWVWFSIEREKGHANRRNETSSINSTASFAAEHAKKPVRSMQQVILTQTVIMFIFSNS